jgi:LPXTG-site transpeptidase (sortase) family protein
VLFVLGALALLAAAVCASGIALNTWLRDQDHYLMLEDIVPLPAPKIMQPTSVVPATPVSAVHSTPAPRATGAAPALQPPVQIRIPALKVERTIINLPAERDPNTGITIRDVDKLFRRGRKDLVGHWGGSASPGQDGNMILVGHNYGVGYNGVFVRLGRLKEGQKVFVTDKAGNSFTYVVDTVQRVKWRRKDSAELEAHWEYMSPSGPERLTLVTCGGANIEPFPDRIYVVAYPLH